MFLKGKGETGPARGGVTLSYIGSEAAVTGDIAATGDLHIDGQVTGDVRCASLVQGSAGEVRGNIHAGEARLAGLVDGAVQAGILILEASARVTGDILYESLSIAPGAEVEGRFKRRKGAGDGSSVAKVEATAKPARAPAAAPAPLFGDDRTAEAAE